MNFRMIFKSLGIVLCIEAGCMLPSLFVSLAYKQDDVKAFALTILVTVLTGLLMYGIRTKTTNIFARDGFAIVSLGWFLISFFGCLPFVISGAIPSIADAFFESVSGFTTTGASILKDVENFPYRLTVIKIMAAATVPI